MKKLNELETFDWELLKRDSEESCFSDAFTSLITVSGVGAVEDRGVEGGVVTGGGT